MIKVFQKILLLLAVITVTAHSIFPHIHLDDNIAIVEDHHHEQPADISHHEDTDNSKDNQHNLFSFAHLDENFVPANGQSIHIKSAITYLPAFIDTYLSNNVSASTKTLFGWYKEYPPPEKDFPSFSLRGPPTA